MPRLASEKEIEPEDKYKRMEPRLLTRQARNVLIKGHARGGGAGAADGHGDTQDGVGAQLGLGPAVLRLAAVQHLRWGWKGQAVGMTRAWVKLRRQR